MTTPDRMTLISRYADGPDRLREALATVPDECLKWQPEPGKWSVHEVICHCADSEMNAAIRIRCLLTAPSPVIQGYDQDEWARRFAYRDHPLDLALAAVAAVRAHTVPLLRTLTAEDWARMGMHTESGRYGAEDWLRTYAEHLEIHARQIERNVAAWNASASARVSRS